MPDNHNSENSTTVSSQLIPLRRQLLWGLGLPLCLFFLLGGIKFLQIRKAIAEGAMKGPPPETVTSYTVEPSVWSKSIQAVGTLRSEHGTTLAAEANGRVAEILIQPGAQVSRGTALIKLDQEVEQAELAAVRAGLDLAKINFSRQQSLRGRKANSQSDLDEAKANLLKAEADEARLRALIARRTVTAPFDGVVGMSRVQPGEWVTTGTEMIDIVSPGNLLNDFEVPEQFSSGLTSGLTVEATVSSFPNETFLGEVIAISRVAKRATRTILVRAKIEDPKGLLKPGMFTRTEVLTTESDQVLPIPITAVQFAPYGNTVYVLDKGQSGKLQTVQSIIVQLGRRKGDFITVKEGLKEGQEIVSSGTFKLRPGAQVRVKNEVVPFTPELNPEPKDA